MTEQYVKDNVVRMLANQEIILESLSQLLLKSPTVTSVTFELLSKIATARGQTQALIDLTRAK